MTPKPSAGIAIISKWIALVFAVAGALLTVVDVVPPLLGRPYVMTPWQSVLLISGCFGVAFLVQAWTSTRPHLEVRLKPGARLRLTGLPACLAADDHAQDTEPVALPAHKRPVVGLQFALDLVHHGEEGDIVTVSGRLDTDWPLLQEFGGKELEGLLSYCTNPDGASGFYKSHNDLLAARGFRTDTAVHMAGEQRLSDVKVDLPLQPTLSGLSSGFKAWGGLTKLALDVHVTAGREVHKLRVVFDAKDLPEAVLQTLDRAIDIMLSECKKSGNLPQKSDIRRLIDCLMDVCGSPKN